MALGIRRLLAVSLVGGVFLMGNIMLLAHWFDSIGAVDFANAVREQFLTGTAITIIVALLILLVHPGAESDRILRQCPVCNHRLFCRGSFCSECGSKW